jgi:hypothetical protein
MPCRLERFRARWLSAALGLEMKIVIIGNSGSGKTWLAKRLPIGVTREDCWTQSIATGSRSFVEAVKRQMRSFAIGRCVRKKAEGFEFRESQLPYKAFFDTGKNDIEGKNLWFWNE